MVIIRQNGANNTKDHCASGTATTFGCLQNGHKFIC